LKKYDLSDFSQYAYNQEMKMISKNLRKSFLENNYSIKSWDFLSNELYNEAEVMNYDNNQYVQNFIKTIERDTLLNFLTNLPPKSYSTTFNRKKEDLFTYLIDYVEEANDSYNNYLDIHKRDKDKERDKDRTRDDNREINKTIKDKDNYKDSYKDSYKDNYKDREELRYSNSYKDENEPECYSYSYSKDKESRERKESRDYDSYLSYKDKDKDLRELSDDKESEHKLKLKLNETSLKNENEAAEINKVNKIKSDVNVKPFLENFIADEKTDINAIIEETNKINFFEATYLPNLSKNENYQYLPDIVKTAILKAIKKSFENGLVNKTQLENLSIDLKKTNNDPNAAPGEDDNIEINMNFDNHNANNNADINNADINAGNNASSTVFNKEFNKDPKDIKVVKDNKDIKGNNDKVILNKDTQRDILLIKSESNKTQLNQLDYNKLSPQDHEELQELKENAKNMLPNENMNVSYNFNKINQMNISINIGKHESPHDSNALNKQYSKVSCFI